MGPGEWFWIKKRCWLGVKWEEAAKKHRKKQQGNSWEQRARGSRKLNQKACEKKHMAGRALESKQAIFNKTLTACELCLCLVPASSGAQTNGARDAVLYHAGGGLTQHVDSMLNTLINNWEPQDGLGSGSSPESQEFCSDSWHKTGRWTW